ncbi:hypothetical protein Naga_100339g4 [Nannochloropsis gaditana]|uniref:Uncharacterized protein n=1 Tax=Nannochloropsis gaditana TaxID=72520 RepID=W7TJ88_9STRA|nr:hypothetical protein Naga_100339g4 [Nannochloropsis gaditana]
MKVLLSRHLSIIMSTVSALSSSSSAAPPSSNAVVPATYSNLNDNALQKPLLDATRPEPVGASILYEDDFIKLTGSSLRIKWYYFPIGASKVIPLKSIQKISLRPLGSTWQGQYKHWGMAIDFKRWWPSDMLRHQRVGRLWGNVSEGSVPHGFGSLNDVQPTIKSTRAFHVGLLACPFFILYLSFILGSVPPSSRRPA